MGRQAVRGSFMDGDEYIRYIFIRRLPLTLLVLVINEGHPYFYGVKSTLATAQLYPFQ